jgi:hypothetical protein
MNKSETQQAIEMLRNNDPRTDPALWALAEENVKLLGEIHSLRRQLEKFLVVS